MLFPCICKPLYDIIGRDNAQLSGFTQIGNTLFVIPQEDVRQPTVKVCFSKIGTQLNRFVIIRQGGTVILQQRRHIATVIIAINKIRSQLDNVVQVILHNFIIDGPSLQASSFPLYPKWRLHSLWLRPFYIPVAYNAPKHA